MFGLILKMFIGLLTSVVLNISGHTKRVSLSNQKSEIQITLVNLHPNEYSQELHYCLFTVKLDRSVESCNTLNDLPNEWCGPDKREDLNLSVFDMITGTNEPKSLTKHITCEF